MSISGNLKVIYFLCLPLLLADRATAEKSAGAMAPQPQAQVQTQSITAYKVAAVQFPLVGGTSKEEFFRKVDEAVVSAKAKGASLVVFPELLTVDVAPRAPRDKEAENVRALAQTITPEYEKWLVAAAKKHQITIMGGSSPRSKNGKVLNTAFLALPDGTLHMQDKLFLTPDEKDWGFGVGDTLNVITTPLGDIAILICFDAEMPRISHLLSDKKPDVILIPSWTGSTHSFNRVNWSAQARAIEHYAYIVKTSTVATKTSVDKHVGQAAVITPQDTGFPSTPKVGKLNASETLIEVIDVNLLRSKRRESGYYPDKEQELKGGMERIRSVR